MTIKLVLLKSGEDIITDVTEMAVGEEGSLETPKRVVGYFFDKACVVKLKEGQQPTENKSAFQVSMFPWMPLSAESRVPVPADWVITMVEPKEKLKTMYLEDVVGNGKGNKDSSSDNESNTDKSD
tara:strand:+ start:52 stop:426 length:375 start_codon:yes stop_codon:yes gene_type:complete